MGFTGQPSELPGKRPLPGKAGRVNDRLDDVHAEIQVLSQAAMSARQGEEAAARRAEAALDVVRELTLELRRKIPTSRPPPPSADEQA